ncbi:MAG: homoserine dehydrogenase [Alphaproteobacteria bacterium]|nr:homoserine dehydrogenase [Alphaproteobacteria bacterium]
MTGAGAGGRLRLGVAGLGTVGAGLLGLIERQHELRVPGRLEVSAVSARSRSRGRGVDISRFRWHDDPAELAAADDVDVVVELIGGSDGPARRTVEAALRAGKPVVTANKALLAEHGVEIAALAEARGVHLLFEAAVGGAIPIVRALRDSLSGVVAARVSGILNGTCNYILSEMLRTGAAYAEVLSEAQRLGYAERDPYLDVSGMDAAHKILILASIAFGARPDLAQVSVEGVDRIEAMDIALANRFDYRIKLVAEAFRDASGVACRVAPALVRIDHPLAQIGGPLNAVIVEGEPVGRLTFTGPGAGAGPTAAAVMGDLARLFDGPATAPFGAPAGALAPLLSKARISQERSAFFIGARLSDRPGVLAALSEALAEAGVSIDKLIQDSAGDTGAAPVAILTHPSPRADVERALARVSELAITADVPRLIRIEARA